MDPRISHSLGAVPAFPLDIVGPLRIEPSGTDVLEVRFPILCRPRIKRSKGLNVGRHVQTIPIDCSTDDHIAVSTVVYVGSPWLERLKAMILRTETIHTLERAPVSSNTVISENMLKCLKEGQLRWSVGGREGCVGGEGALQKAHGQTSVFLGGLSTYKVPSMKMQVTTTFCRSPRSSPHTIGRGSINTIKSKNIFVIPLPRKNSTSSMHRPVCSLFQK